MIRYGLYYAPDLGSHLWDFGNRVLGYDAQTGKTPSRQDGWGFLENHTSKPRTYGFHATLKQPFALRDGYQEADLVSAIKSFCKAEPCFEMPKLRLGLWRDHLCLVPNQSSPELQTFAGRVVSCFERFRPVLSQEDRNRRLNLPLNQRQLQLLDSWGYPFLFDCFQFHMTLTQALSEHEQLEVMAFLDPAFKAIAYEDYSRCQSLSLYKQNGKGQNFRLITQFSLTGALA